MLHGMPFEVGELWRDSALFRRKPEDSIFEAIDTDIGRLKPLKDDHGHFDLCLDLPDIEDPCDTLDPPPTNVENVPEVGRRAEADDIWDLDLDQSAESGLAALSSWEAFAGVSAHGAERTSYLSEEGLAAFDAALRTVEKSIGVLPQDFTLKALCSLALGRSSSLFEWNHAEDKFRSTLEGASIAGASLACSNSIIEELVDVGSMTMRLRNFVESSRQLNACSAAMALRSCMALVVDTVEESISGRVGTIRSALQLQQLVLQPGNLLKLLTIICDKTKTLRTDESIISALSELVHELAEREIRFCEILETFLARVSGPWLEMLSADLGLRNVTGERAYEPQSETSDHEHTFLDTDDEHLVQATKHAVAVLRQQCPDHPLVKHDEAKVAARLADSSVDQAHAIDVAKQYELEMTQAILGLTRSHSAPEGATTALADESSWCSNPFQTDHMSELATQMSLEPGCTSLTESDKLRHDTMQAMRLDDNAIATKALGSSVGYSPITSLRPLMIVQHRLVNGVLARQLLREYDLLLHLERQRSFQLMGNGTFVSRLSRALFDKEIQSAERKRGVVPTADEMGLRVGATKDQRWPPASSELQLTLMGLLSDHRESVHVADSAVRHSQLSFAIRELPEAEIERVLDPHSIYAMDFLKIEYTTYSPLDSVITPSSLVQYDSVFRYLLKLLRLLHVTSSLPRTMPGSRIEPTPVAILAFAQRARDFVVVLVGHVMNIGIAAPWQAFLAALQGLERELHAEDTQGQIGSKATIGVDGLRQLHESCLDRIRTRLFLKKKQEKLRIGMEEVLISILRCATDLQTEPSALIGSEDLEDTRAKISRFLGLLADAVDKPVKKLSVADAEDLDMMRILLAKLDWNGYYAASD